MSAAEAARHVGLGVLFDHKPECLVGLWQSEVATGDAVLLAIRAPIRLRQSLLFPFPDLAVLLQAHGDIHVGADQQVY